MRREGSSEEGGLKIARGGRLQMERGVEMLCENLKGVTLACYMKSHSISTSERRKVVRREGK